jgi:hypothetical protein
VVKLEYPHVRTVSDAQIMALARRAYLDRHVPVCPVDAEHAVEMLRDAGLIRTPRTGWHFAGPGERHYNHEYHVNTRVEFWITVAVALLCVGLYLHTL